MRLIYVSPVPLSSFAQRPHHFVEWFHRRHDAEVLWIEPGPSRLPRLSDLWRLKGALGGSGPDLSPPWSKENWLRHLRCQAVPVEPLHWGRVLNQRLWRPALKTIDEFVTPDTHIVLGKPCAFSLELSRRYRGLNVVFDVMDHLSDFFEGRSKLWMRQAETLLAQEVRWIMASSTALTHNLAIHETKLRTVLNGLSLPPSHGETDGILIQTPDRPVFGYVGTIDHWFDWEGVIQLAEENPQARIDLVGPCGYPPKMDLPDNIRLLPPIPQHEVHNLMRGFSLGIIPFRLCRLTQYVDPVKYYEYRAAGLPVLSSRFGEMAHRGPTESVFFFDDLWSEHITIEQVVTSRPTVEQTQQFMDLNAWHRRFEAVEFLQSASATESSIRPSVDLATSPQTGSEETTSRTAQYWDAWQRSRPASGQRFTDWVDHPTVLHEVLRRAFGSPQIGFLDFLSSHYPQLTNAHALSLCCGDASFELGLLKRGVFGRITGYELAGERIEVGRRLAIGQPIRFVQVDVNHAEFGMACYDAVFAKSALHHIENLEHVVEQIARCLCPGGLLITIDFFGPSRFQWTDNQLEVCNAFWQTHVPPALRVEPDGSPTPLLERPRLVDMVAMDPSEAARSSDIYDLLISHFELEHDIPLGGALLNLLLWGERVNRFDPTDELHNQVLREAVAHETALMQSNVLGSDFRLIVARPREGLQNPRANVLAEARS